MLTKVNYINLKGFQNQNSYNPQSNTSKIVSPTFITHKYQEATIGRDKMIKTIRKYKIQHEIVTEEDSEYTLTDDKDEYQGVLYTSLLLMA